MIERAVTLGLRTVGHVRQCGDRWVAYDVAGEALGAFPSADKATAAVLDAARTAETGGRYV